jgi:AcrR family transcriptional regulator
VTGAKSNAEHERPLELRRAAAELFFAKGYEAATTREIAQALGIKSASIYYHYPDKEEILFQIIRSTMEQLIAGLRMVLGENVSEGRALAGLVVNHVIMHTLRPKEATLGDTELRSLSGARSEEILRMRDEYQDLVIGVLERGLEAGTFTILEPKLTAFSIIAQCTNVGIWFRADGRLALEEIAHVYANLALRMVGSASVDQKAIADLFAATQEFHLRDERA